MVHGGFAGKVAVGDGRGVGHRAGAGDRAGRSGAKVAISDVDTEGLADTEERLKAIGAPVKADRLDVTEREAFLLYADAVKEHFGKVNQIYNNAGIAFAGDVEVSQFKDIERVMDVDFWGVVNGTKAFLPHLIASGDGHVVNVSSLFGMFSVPGQAAYNSAKFAVRGFTEALRQEMALAGHPVAVTTVHPGGIKTGDRAQRDRGRGRRHQGAGADLRQEAGQHHARAGRQDHPRGRPQEEGPRAGRSGRQGARRRRAAHRFGIPEAVLDALRGCAAEETHCSPRRPQNARLDSVSRTTRALAEGSAAQRVLGQPGARRPLRGSAPSATCPRIWASAPVSSTPAIWLMASTCCSLSSLRRYSGTTFSARISAGCDRPAPPRRPGTSGAAVVVQAALT